MENSEAKIIDLQAFRTRRTLVGERKTGVQQAFQPSSQNGGRSPSSAAPRGADVDLSTRIERIKSSITRINQLMAELRSMSPENKNSPKTPQ